MCKERNFEDLFTDMLKATRNDEGINVTKKEFDVILEKLLNGTLELIEENKRHREALEFYADKSMYTLYHSALDGTTNDIYFDGGKRARKALAGDKNA